MHVQSPSAPHLIAKARTWVEDVPCDDLSSILFILEYINPDELFDLLDKKLDQEVDRGRDFYQSENDCFREIKTTFTPILTTLRKEQAEKCIERIEAFIKSRWGRCDKATLIYLYSLFNPEKAVALLSQFEKEVTECLNQPNYYSLVLEYFDWISPLLSREKAHALLNQLFDKHQKYYIRYSNYFASLPSFALRYVPYNPKKAKAITDEALTLHGSGHWTTAYSNFKVFYRECMKVYQRTDETGIQVVLRHGHTKLLKSLPIWDKPLQILRTYKQIQNSDSPYRQDVEAIFLLKVINLPKLF